MTPFASFTYFAWLLYPVVPTMVLGWFGRISRYWIFAVTVLFLAFQYATPSAEILGQTVPVLALLAGYAVYQYALTYLFLGIRTRAAKRGLPFYVVLALSLIPLLVVKITPLTGTQAIIAFVGVSYVSFRALDAIFGIQDGLIKKLPLVQYLTFLLFFPTISAGPIDRYRRFERDWNHPRTREEFVNDLDAAVHKVFIGLLYKFILAYLINLYWLEPASKGTDLWSNISYMYAYSFYLFFDFAGYSLFAIGLSYLFGIHTPENFNRPFLADSIREFWNRWHMSLSFWFRDHVYARFLMASARHKWFRSRYTASYLGFLITWGLIGAWHGLEWHFLIYGFYHAVLLIGHDLFSRWNQTRGIWKDTLPWKIAGILITFQLVCFGFLIFSGHLG